MFASLAKHRVILVTGPQRSGTTIAARMIAHDTGHAFMSEESFGISDKAQWLMHINASDRVVIQCPAMSAYIVHVANYGDVLTVFMMRNIADIVRSQERIGWPAHEKAAELLRYGRAWGEPAAVAYDRWYSEQRPQLDFLELDYLSLADHPLWLPVELRQDFGARQTA